MISTKNAISSNGISSYITYGTGEYKINSFEIQEASTGAVRVRMNLESKPINDPSFSGVDGALGQVGRVSLTSYINPTSPSYKKSIDIFVRKISEIADAVNVREAVDSIEADSVANYIAKVSPLLCGKFAHWCIATEQYMVDDSVRNSLLTPLYGFVSSDPNKVSFDKSNSYHFKAPEVVNAPSSLITGDSSGEW